MATEQVMVDWRWCPANEAPETWEEGNGCTWCGESDDHPLIVLRSVMVEAEMASLRAEVKRLQEEVRGGDDYVATLQTKVERLQQLADHALLLGPARMVLDRCAVALEGTEEGQEAEQMAQRIVDLIGHSTTNEPPHALVELDRLRGEVERLRAIVEQPDPQDFMEASVIEARYQQVRWGTPMQPGTTHDSHKSDADWFWLIGYLAGKALHKPGDDSVEKQLHRITTVAAAAANWHAAVKARVEVSAT